MISLLYLFLGCSADRVDSPASVQITINPETYNINLTLADQLVSGTGKVLPFSVTATHVGLPRYEAYPVDQSTGNFPAPNIEIQIMSLHDGVYVIPQKALQVAAPPFDPVWGSCEQAEEYCTDLTATSDECIWATSNLCDSTTGQHYQFVELQNFFADGSSYYGALDEADSNTLYGPNYLITETNNRGVFEGWLFVDSFPVDATDSTGPAEVMAFTAWSSSVLTISMETTLDLDEEETETVDVAEEESENTSEPAEPEEETETDCADGEDNDGDGATDCDDGDCEFDDECQ